MIACYLDSFAFPLSRNHRFHVKKLFTGFTQIGWHTRKIDSLNDIMRLSENDIVYISNHFYVEKHLRPFRKNNLKRLFSIIKKSRCKFLLWNFHDLPLEDEYNLMRSKNILHLGEDMYPSAIAREEKLSIFRALYKVYSLRYSATKLPTGRFVTRSFEEVDVQFVGSRYKTDWLDEIQKQKDIKTFIRLYPPVQNEIERLNSFESTRISLCFHHDSAIEKGIVTERFYEAIACGNLIIHDHPRIEEHFGSLPGIAYVEDVDNLIETIKNFKALNPLELSTQRANVFAAWKMSGNAYCVQCNKIIEKLNEEH